MADYTWPGFRVNRFEMRVAPNTRAFTSPLSASTQTIDLLGAKWRVSIDLIPLNDDQIEAGAREAFFDRLCGQVNRVLLHNLRRPIPLGSLRGADTVVAWVNTAGNPAFWVNGSGAAVNWFSGNGVVAERVPQLGNTVRLRSLPGRTVEAGDLYKFAGQLVRITQAGAVAGDGTLTVEFTPRARQAWPAGTVAEWDRPTARFQLATSDGVPVTHTPGAVAGSSFDLIETP